MKHIKFAAFLLLLMLLQEVKAEIITGTAGLKASYEFDSSTGQMRIYGTGAVDALVLTYADIASLEPSITSVVVDEGITKLFSYAFAHLTKVKSISLPSTLESCEIATFHSCSSLVTVSGRLPYYREEMFYGCSSLKSVPTPNLDYPAVIPKCCFYGCSSLESFVVPYEVATIEVSAFANTGLREVTLPNGLGVIKHQAFWNCSSLKSVVIPPTVTIMGTQIFAKCTSLESVDMQNSPSTGRVPDSCFYECSSLKQFKFPSSNLWIGKGSFGRCTSLEDLVLPANVTSLCEGSFYGCTGLRKITFRAAQCPSLIGSQVFNYISDPGTLVLPEGADYESVTKRFPTWNVVRVPQTASGKAGPSCHYEFNWPNMRIYGEGNVYDNFSSLSDVAKLCDHTETLVVEDGVEALGTHAFSNFTDLLSVSLPTTLTSIGNFAFQSCESLPCIIIPKGVNKIGDSAFSYCSSLSDVEFKADNTTISGNAFLSVSDKGTLTVPEGRKSLYAVLKEALGIGWVFGGDNPLYDEVPDVDAEGYYLITTVPDLLWFRDNLGGFSRGFKARQKADLDLSPYCHPLSSNQSEATWVPLFYRVAAGSYGTYDGQGHSIKGLYCNGIDFDIQYPSFFGYAGFNGATPSDGWYTDIKNLTIEGTVKGNTSSAMFAAAGQLVRFEGCTSRGSITVSTEEGNANVGGIGGRIKGAVASYVDCHNEASITVTMPNTGNQFVGGVGGAGFFSRCTNTGTLTVDGTCHVGGVAGTLPSSLFGESLDRSMEYCSNQGNIQTVWSITGGAVYAGGLVGRISNGVPVCSSWSNADVVMDATSVPAQNKVGYGGLWGSRSSSGGAFVTPNFTNCYYNSEKHCSTTTAYGVGKTAAQFQSGEVAYLLGSPWGQVIDAKDQAVEFLPLVNSPRVYKLRADDGTSFYYSNCCNGDPSLDWNKDGMISVGDVTLMINAKTTSRPIKELIGDAIDAILEKVE